MEMDGFVNGSEKLCEKTEKSLEEIRHWTWSELLEALNQCQDLLPEASRSSGVLDKCLDCVIERIALSCEPSPCPSPDSSVFKSSSCDTRSTDGVKSNIFQETWWFKDLVLVNIRLIEIIVNSMVAKNFDNRIISKFLFYYQKSRFSSCTLMDDKIRIVESVVEMLYSLDRRSISYKSLFGLLRVSTNMNLSDSCRDNLEGMIGLRLDEVTLDNLLVPLQNRKKYHYDVNLIIRLLKLFLGEGVSCVQLSRLNKVGKLMDLYASEVAPDPYLKPSKFLALITALPDSARDSYDEVYHAMNLYIEVHSGLSDEQKMKICSGLNYEKLSSEAFHHLSQNTKFPSKSIVQALVSQQRKLKNLLQDTNQENFTDSSPFTSSDKGSDQIVIYAKKLHLSDENVKLKAHLQEMQWRVMELEKVCRNMRIKMKNMMKSRQCGKEKSIPKLCS